MPSPAEKEIDMQRRILLIALAVVVLVAPFPAQAQKAIKVGMPMPLSGPPALFGEPASKGAQMFVDETNAKGGVLGRKLELVVRDSKADANEAVRVRSEEHTSELQSLRHLVCRLLLEKKKPM